jgi:hypothetical protein
MAGFRKRPAEGENPGGFRAITPGLSGQGGFSRDPTEPGRTPYYNANGGERWKRLGMDELANGGEQASRGIASGAAKPMFGKGR